jgi:hypothetical protein
MIDVSPRRNLRKKFAECHALPMPDRVRITLVMLPSKPTVQIAGCLNPSGTNSLQDLWHEMATHKPMPVGNDA